MNPSVSASSNLDKRTDKLLSLSAIILLLSALIAFVLIMLGHQKIKTVQTIRQEILTIQRSQANTSELQQYVSSNSQTVGIISQVFPNESNIDQVYQTIIDLAKNIDASARLSFNAIGPSQLDNQLVIPLQMELAATSSQVVTIMRQIERLPHIIQIVSAELHHPLHQDGRAVISISLFVDEDFHKP